MMENKLRNICTVEGGIRWHNWWRYYATSWKVMGLIPDVAEFFSIYLINSSHNMALEFTQPLT
jgi:hypothetical protein